MALKLPDTFSDGEVALAMVTNAIARFGQERDGLGKCTATFKYAFELSQSSMPPEIREAAFLPTEADNEKVMNPHTGLPARQAAIKAHEQRLLDHLKAGNPWKPKELQDFVKRDTEVFEARVLKNKSLVHLFVKFSVDSKDFVALCMDLVDAEIAALNQV